MTTTPTQGAELVAQFEKAVNACTRYHTEYMGKEMPLREYERFARLRDETIPRLRAELIAALRSPGPQAGEPSDAVDAARYRWLARKVSAHGVIDGWAFGFPTHLSLPAPVLAMRDPEAALGQAIDAALAQARVSIDIREDA
jgi:hypothetical protein